MMAFHKSLCFLTAIFITLICSSRGYTFEVGGRNGWSRHPSENYDSWAGRLRFLINDTLHFKYDGGVDSVLVVNKGDYDACNVDSPVMKLDGGDSTFKFDRSGPFYFISGSKGNCDQGQKLIVVVLARRNHSPPPLITVSPPLVSPPVGGNTPRGGSASTPGGSGITGSASPSGNTPEGAPSPSDSRGSASFPGGSRGRVSSPANAPDGGSSLSPGEGGGASSSIDEGGASSSSRGGGPSAEAGSQLPRDNNPASNVNTPSRATPAPLSGTIIASLVTISVALWWSI